MQNYNLLVSCYNGLCMNSVLPKAALVCEVPLGGVGESGIKHPQYRVTEAKMSYYILSAFNVQRYVHHQKYIAMQCRH